MSTHFKLPIHFKTKKFYLEVGGGGGGGGRWVTNDVHNTHPRGAWGHVPTENLKLMHFKHELCR